MVHSSAPQRARSGQLGKAIALNKQIIACKSPAAILSVYQSQGEFNHVNLATAITDLDDRTAATSTTRGYERSSNRPR